MFRYIANQVDNNITLIAFIEKYKNWYLQILFRPDFKKCRHISIINL